jgi:LmbE family N-acetylglucosaminyl deacetylase
MTGQRGGRARGTAAPGAGTSASIDDMTSASDQAPAPPIREPHTDRPERLMVIVAHPDDADFGPAGTVAGWVRAGSVAHLVCCTSGDAGSDDPATDPLELARLREQEQRAAAVHVGYEEVSFLHRPDGALANDLALREQLVTLIRTFRPDAVLTMDPTVVIHREGGIQHTDHRAAAIAAVDAVYPAARNPMAFPHLAQSGLAAHEVRWVYLFWSDEPTAWVDVSATIEQKIAALREHRSQLRKPDELEERIREWSRESGAEIGSAAAESFRVLDLG